MGVPSGTNGLEQGTPKAQSGGRRQVPCWRQRITLAGAGCLAALAVVTLTVTTTLTDTSSTLPGCCEHPATTPTPLDPEFILGDGRQIIHRSEWSTEPPAYKRPLHHPTPFVVIGHTAGTACRGKAECFPLLTAYSYAHRTDWEQPDIAYNFLIDVAGNIYEGRGWDATNNHASWVKRCNLGVSLMGDFRFHNVTQAMAQSLQQLLQLGVKLGKLDSDYRLVAHNQVLATRSPGSKVLDLIASWPHRCTSNCDDGVQCIYENTEALNV